jgi:4'-phosphopantetheinyl transferase
VHCWSVRLDARPERLAALDATLGAEERARSARFRFERDRRRFVVAHGTLRDLLGRYLDVDPQRIGYAYNAFGKPQLGAELGGRLRFNLSHSGDLALIAVAAGIDVGIDVERIREDSPRELAELARRFFSPAEVENLRGVPPHLYAREFCRHWTKKEAYVKARGEDLATTLDSLVVPSAGWTLLSLEPAHGYVGALAVPEGSLPPMSLWEFR